MKTKSQSRILLFVLMLLVWLALTAGAGHQEIITGVAVALVVALAAGRFVSGFPRQGFLRRLGYGVVYFFVFVWEMIKANVHVALIVLHPFRPIRPGIVKVRTALKRDTARAILANSITLTPGTLTVDIHPQAGELYIHCITVAGVDVETNTRTIAGRFEPLLKEVFE